MKKLIILLLTLNSFQFIYAQEKAPFSVNGYSWGDSREKVNEKAMKDFPNNDPVKIDAKTDFLCYYQDAAHNEAVYFFFNRFGLLSSIRYAYNRKYIGRESYKRKRSEAAAEYEKYKADFIAKYGQPTIDEYYKDDYNEKGIPPVSWMIDSTQLSLHVNKQETEIFYANHKYVAPEIKVIKTYSFSEKSAKLNQLAGKYVMMPSCDKGGSTILNIYLSFFANPDDQSFYMTITGLHRTPLERMKMKGNGTSWSFDFNGHQTLPVQITNTQTYMLRNLDFSMETGKLSFKLYNLYPSTFDCTFEGVKQ